MLSEMWRVAKPITHKQHTAAIQHRNTPTEGAIETRGREIVTRKSETEREVVLDLSQRKGTRNNARDVVAPKSLECCAFGSRDVTTVTCGVCDSATRRCST